jgi:hypothetical protein
VTVSILHPPTPVPAQVPFPGFVPEPEQPEALAGQVVLMSPGAVPEGAEVVGVLVRLPRPAPVTPAMQSAVTPAMQSAVTPGRASAVVPAMPPTARTVPPQFGAVKGARRPISAGLTIDDPARIVLAHGEPLELTRLEFDLLQYFADHPARVLTRSSLLSAVWDRDPAWSSSRTVDVHVLRLRRALGPEHSRALQTVRGVGYRWVP